jgi:RuvB-like protein 2
MTDEALELLTRIATETSLRYALQLIILSNFAAKLKQVEIRHIQRVFSLFVDVKRSTKFLIEYQDEFMFSELGEKDITAMQEG